MRAATNLILSKYMKTKQQIFNKVWRYFIRDGHPQAMGKDGGKERCFYRGAQSNCAVGCQLPNKLYSRELEGKGVEILLREPKIADYFGYDNLPLLKKLQTAHDFKFRQLKFQLEEIAQKFQLKIPKN